MGGECPEKEADKYIIFNTLSIATKRERETKRERTSTGQALVPSMAISSPAEKQDRPSLRCF